MQDDLAGLIGRIDFYVTNVGHSLCAEASRALKALTRENAELKASRDHILHDARCAAEAHSQLRADLTRERDEARAEVERLRPVAGDQQLADELRLIAETTDCCTAQMHLEMAAQIIERGGVEHPNDFGLSVECDDLRTQLTATQARLEEAVDLVNTLWSAYKEIADSGDAGFWSAEETEEGVKTLSFLAQQEGQSNG